MGPSPIHPLKLSRQSGLRGAKLLDRIVGDPGGVERLLPEAGLIE
jgi:hypothetical protein